MNPRTVRKTFLQIEVLRWTKIVELASQSKISLDKSGKVKWAIGLGITPPMILVDLTSGLKKSWKRRLADAVPLPSLGMILALEETRNGGGEAQLCLHLPGTRYLVDCRDLVDCQD